MSRYDWMGAAACAQADPDLWHGEGAGVTYTAALRICRNCPVQRQCADHASRLEGDASRRTRHGVYAGHTPTQRVTNSSHVTRESNREAIIRLAARGGMDAYQIAEHVGVDVRTVWRTLKNHREQMGEAA